MRSFWKPTKQALARHLSRLCAALEDLVQRLREGIARAISQVTANAVHEAVEAVLDDASRPGQPPPPYSPYRSRDRLGWDQEPDPFRKPGGQDPYYEEPWLADDDNELTESSKPEPSRWRQMLAAGCWAAVWWLQRFRERHPQLSALGVGLLTAVTTLASCPVTIGRILLALGTI